MTANQWISLLLLIGRIITFTIMVIVVRKQVRFLKAKNYPELNVIRRNNVIGSVAILLGNIVPIVLDTMGLFNRGSFSLLLLYVFSNNITAMISAYMIYYNLKLSEKIKLSGRKGS